MALSVNDKRPVGKDDQNATEQNVAQALGEVLAREGVEVSGKSPNRFVVTLEYPSEGLDGVDPESCVEMSGELTFADGRTMTGKAVGCAEMRNLFGMSYGPQVSRAFQSAAGSLLQSVDEGYRGANDPLVFESAYLEVPDFPGVGVKELTLHVADEYSEDGSLGKNLTSGLSAAFAKAGVSLDDDASQSMTVTLSHPSEDFAGRDKATCIKIDVKAKLQRATAFGRGTSCRGLGETGHHKALSDALLALWTEYAEIASE